MTDGATVDYSGNATSRATLDAPIHNMTYADFLKQYAALQAADAMPIDGQDFVVVMHPWVYATLLSDPVFVNAFIQETSNSPLRSGYMGRWLNCRVFVTSNARTVADSGVDSSTTVYMCLFFGKEAYGYCGLGNITPDLMDGGGDGFANNTGKSVKPVQLIVNQLGSAGTADPLNQRATIGWKMSLASTVLNANWIRCLECTSIASDD